MLRRRLRLSRSEDIRLVMRRGRLLHTPHLTVRFLSSGNSTPRITFVVSAKVSKKATDRNRLKRQLRSIVRERLTLFPAHDYVFFSKAVKPLPTFLQLRTEVDRLLPLLPPTRYHRQA